MAFWPIFAHILVEIFNNLKYFIGVKLCTVTVIFLLIIIIITVFFIVDATRRSKQSRAC
jgi:hypothetical protein